MSSAKPQKSMPKDFVSLIATKAAEQNETLARARKEVPILDEMEMDVPFFGDFMNNEREFPEDESETEMQCLLNMRPSLSMSSLSL